MTALYSIEDELFELKVADGLRLYRRVEFVRCIKETQFVIEEDDEDDIGGNCKPVDVTVKKWFDVRKEGQPLELDLAVNQSESGEDTDRPKPTYAAPFASCQVSAKRALLANQVHLNEA